MKKSNSKSARSVAIYGGNGFVGVHVAKELVENNFDVICISRTGHKPLHLKDEKWSERARWCKGDAAEPSQECLKQVDVVISTVGSAPTPTFSKTAFDQKVFENGVCNSQLIKAASKAGIKTVVLLGAKIPWPLNSKHFAYAKGKKMAQEAAENFTQHSSSHSALVLKPGVVLGKRVIGNGKIIPLDTLFYPFKLLMPWQFVSAEKVAKRICLELTENTDTDATPPIISPRFKTICNRDI